MPAPGEAAKEPVRADEPEEEPDPDALATDEQVDAMMADLRKKLGW
jgi:hypothetical protein